MCVAFLSLMNFPAHRPYKAEDPTQVTSQITYLDIRCQCRREQNLHCRFHKPYLHRDTLHNHYRHILKKVLQIKHINLLAKDTYLNSYAVTCHLHVQQTVISKLKMHSFFYQNIYFEGWTMRYNYVRLS